MHQVLAKLPIGQVFAGSTVAFFAAAGICIAGQRAATASQVPGTLNHEWSEATVAYRKFQKQDPMQRLMDAGH